MSGWYARLVYRAAVALLILVAPVFASRAVLESALQVAAAADPMVAAPLHPSDFRTLDDRIAARELADKDVLGEIADQFVRSFEDSTARVLASAALRIDENQPAFAPLYQVYRKSLAKLGLPASRIPLYIYGDLEVEAFAWGLPPPEGHGFLGLSSRTARLFLEGDQGRKLSEADLDFVFVRELAHLAAGHATYRMITTLARTAENRLNAAARDVLRTLYRTTGLGGVALSAVVEITRPIQRFLVSRAMHRFFLWDLNAAVGAARAGVLASPAEGDEALKGAVRVLLMAMLQDLSLVERVDVAAFTAQVREAAADGPSLVRDPSHPIRTSPLSRGLADVVRRLLGLPHPAELPHLAPGHAELLADTVRWAASAERRDLARWMQSSDPFDRALLAVRRLTDLEEYAQVGLVSGEESRNAGAMNALVQALATHVGEDVQAHAGDADGSLLGRLIEETRALSHLSHVAVHRVLESLAASNTLAGPAQAKLEAALVDSRFRNLIETWGYRAEVEAWLDKVGAPRGVKKRWLEAIVARTEALKAGAVDGLTASARIDAAPDWMSAHRDPARTDGRRTAWECVVDEVAERLDDLDRKDLAARVRSVR